MAKTTENSKNYSPVKVAQTAKTKKNAASRKWPKRGPQVHVSKGIHVMGMGVVGIGMGLRLPSYADEDEDDVSCEVCGSGAVGPGNDLVLCDGEHEVTVAYHQACLEPTLDPIPEGDWFCLACCEAAQAMDMQSKADSSYPPSQGTLTDGHKAPSLMALFLPASI